MVEEAPNVFVLKTIEWAAVVDGPTKVPERVGLVAMTVLGKTGTIRVKAAVFAARALDAAPEEEARPGLAGVVMEKPMPDGIATLLGTTGPVGLAVAGKIVVGMVTGLIFPGCTSSSAFAHSYIADVIL